MSEVVAVVLLSVLANAVQDGCHVAYRHRSGALRTCRNTYRDAYVYTCTAAIVLTVVIYGLEEDRRAGDNAHAALTMIEEEVLHQ